MAMQSEAARAAEARDMLAWASQIEARAGPREEPRRVEALGGPPGFSGAAVGSSGQSIRVKIVSARGLRAADWTLSGGKSDPYCICEIPGKPYSKFQTAVIAKTLTPVWNHEQELSGWAVGDSVLFNVYDKDTGKSDDFLGTLTLTSPQFHPQGFDGELPLSQAGRGIKAYLRLQISAGPPEAAGAGGVWACPLCTLENPADAAVCQACESPRPQAVAPAPPLPPPLPPPVAPAAAPSRAASRKTTLASSAGAAPLQVLIISARGLRAADWNGKSDPYCVCEVVGKPHSRLQTQTIDKTLSPMWNYAGELPDYGPGDALNFTVYDKDWGKSDDLLGRLTLTGEQVSAGFDGELPLSEAGRGVRAFLRLRVAPPAAGPAWECPSCSLQNDAGAAVCAACERPRPEADGFQTFAGRDTLQGRTAFQMPAADLGQCRRLCRERGCGAFVVHRGTAYFRRESSAECLGGLVESPDSTAYVDTGAGARADLGPLTAASASSSSFGSRANWPPAPGAPPPIVAPASSSSFSPRPNRPPAPGAPVPLKVTVLCASGLRAADWGGKSDPFCVCQVVSKPQSKFQTPSIDRTLEPVWNHPGYLADYAAGDVLEFAVYDKSWGRSDELLGKALLTSAQILPGGFEGRLPLADARGDRGASVTVRVEPYEAQARAAPGAGAGPGPPLRLTLVSARGLRAAEWALRGGRSEPYCVCEVLGRPQASVRSPVVGKTLEPVWNYSAELPGYAAGEPLAFAVYHQTGGRSDELLGRAELPAAQFAAGFDGELPLADGKGGQAFVRVRVERPGAGVPGALPEEPLEVTLEGARGLRHGSPYCLCEIPGKPQARFRTAALDRTPNPLWSHTALVQGYAPGDSLVFTVCDSMKRDDVLGRLILTSAQFYPTGFRGELPLTDAGRGASACLALRVALPGQAPAPPPAALRAGPGPGLRLGILGARGLRNVHWFSYSDAYCVCQVPGKPYSKVQTVVVKNSLDPSWNHEAEVGDYAPGDALEFTVWNRGVTGFDELLGRALLSGAQFHPGGFDGEVPLLDQGAQSGGFLRLRVAPGWGGPGAPLAAAPPPRPPPRGAAQPPDCSLLATAFSVLSGVPAGLPSDAGPGLAGKAPPLLAGQWPGGTLPLWCREPQKGGREGVADRVGDQFGMQVASVLDSLGEVYRNAGNFEEALVQSKKALDIRVDAFGDRHPDTAASLYSIGSALRLQDRLEEAWQCHTRALEIRLQAHGEWHADTAASCTCLGAILLQQGEVDSALDHYLRALEISRTTLGEQHPDTAACYNDVGAVFERKGELGSALQYLLKALEIQRQLVGEQHPLLGDAYNNVGAVLWQEGRLNEALEHHQRAMEIRLQVLGDRHPDTALSYGNVGVILERLGRYPEALEHQQRALEIRLVALGQQHSEAAASYINLGVVLERMLRFEEAIEHYRKAHSIVLAAVGARHAWTEQANLRIKRCERSWRTTQSMLKI